MLRRFFRRRRVGAPASSQLDRELLRWSEADAWNVRDATEGTLILGATGSGKTSGSGAAIARAMLGSGFGGLVLTVKPDERACWERYCEQTGRFADLVVFGAAEPLRFNFLEYEASREGSGAGLTENIVSLFATVLEVAERGLASGGGREDEGYWRRAGRQLVRNAIDLLRLAGAPVSVPDLYRVVVSAPQSRDDIRSEDWKAKSLCFRRLAEADRREKSVRDETDLEVVADYWLIEFPSLSEKTRSVIVSTFTSMVDVLNRGLLRELFCGETNITPEAVADGKILLIDLPVKEFAEVGQFAQVIWKYLFQRAIERRAIGPDSRPVFLWADEAQHFLTSHDMLFQTTCRASQVATVYLTQNVSNVYAALGGSEKGRSEAASLFANLNTKILHANGDPVTNEWAASLIGRTLQYFASANSGKSSDEDWAAAVGMDWLGGSRSSSAGFSESYEFEVQPAAFTQLATGGPANGWTVEGIVFENGRVFRSTGRTWMRADFRQRAAAGKGA